MIHADSQGWPEAASATDPALSQPRPDQVGGAQDDLSRGILTTEIHPLLARVLTIGFLALIVAVPVIQTTLELVRRSRIQALTVFTRVPTRANLDEFEKDLTRQSFARQIVKPRMQLNLSRDLGFGSTQVILGREGWLFYRPGVDWLAGPGLLDATRLALR